MKYRLSIFNLLSGLIIAAAILIAYFHMEWLNEDKDAVWIMLAAAGVGVLGAIIDLVMQALIKNTKLLIILQAIIAVVFIVPVLFAVIGFAL